MEDPQEIGEYELVLEAEYGAQDGGEAFGRISAVAAHTDGSLAIADEFSCEIHLIRPTGTRSVFGSCGGGPAEFGQISKIAFRHDTLVVLDGRNRTLVFLGMDGSEIRRLSLPYDRIAGLDSFGQWTDSTAIAGLRLLPASYAGATHDLLSMVDLREGRILPWSLRDADLSTRNERNMARGVSFCSNVEGEPMIAAANWWAPQTITFQGTDLRPFGNFGVNLEWKEAREDSLGILPALPAPTIACGAHFVLIMYQARERTEDGIVVAKAYLEARSYSGEIVVSSLRDTPGTGTIFVTALAAATGDRFFSFTNSFFDYPVVREYRLVQTRANSRSR